MSSNTPVDAIGGDTQLNRLNSDEADPGQAAAQAELQQAFQEGVAKFGMMMLQSAQNDIIESINDNTSNPDAPG
jgi:hypothetical protein